MRISGFALLLFTIGLLSSTASFPPYASVEWLTPTTIDMGDLPKDQFAYTSFKFKNTGPDSLYIDNVRVACGCTSPNWEEIAVAPDSIGIIQIEYDAYDPGYFSKWIKVYFRDFRKAEKLWIEGYIENI